MLQIYTTLLASLLYWCHARDALQYFIKHRRLLNSSFTIIQNVNSTDGSWVEYKYTFINNNRAEIKRWDGAGGGTAIERKIVNVGIYYNYNLPFDCKLNDNDETNESLTGYSVQLLKLMLMDNLNFEVKYKILNPSAQHLRNKNLTNIFTEHEEIDLILCHPEFNHDKRLIHLYPTIKSEYVLVYKSNRLRFTKDIFILTFAGTLWLCFLVSLIILGISLHISTERYAILYDYDLWNWVDITLWANAAACQQGLSHTPSGLSSCVIFFLGYSTSYLLYTGFAAGITSLLLQKDTENDITVGDLESMKLQTVSVTDVSFLKHTYDFVNNSVDVGRINYLFQYIDQENTIGIAPKVFIDQYLNANYETAEKYVVVSFPETHFYYKSFAVLKNDSYKNLLNNKLSILQQAGLLQNTLRRNVLPKLIDISKSNYSSAGVEHVGSAILILVVGTLSSAVFLVIELLIALYRNKCV